MINLNYLSWEGYGTVTLLLQNYLRSGKMARVLFINGGSEGHINPTIGVVQELISRGEEVVYFTIEAFRERIEKTGATVRTIDGEKFIKAFLSGGRNYLLERINGLLRTVDIVIPSVLEQIKGEHFDYIIHDSMFAVDVYLPKSLSFPQSILVLLLRRQMHHSIKCWNSFLKKFLQK